MKTIYFAVALLFAVGSPGTAMAQEAAQMTVWKSPWCGCCGHWVKRMEQAGYSVEVKEVEDLDAVKKMAGVPGELQSCHTARIDGYTIEGHVPAADVERLLSERPKVDGLAVPGMPSGSPGMENGEKDPYDVVTFTRKGETKVFSSYK
jgi:hypothetical protein